jgi:hypothetical protein
MSESAVTNASRKKPPRYSPAAEIGSGSNVDRALAVCGVLIACSSLAFAGYMLADANGPPRIAGMEYLSIFARPSHPIAAAQQPMAPVAEEAPTRLAAETIDPTPTGSISNKIASGQPVNFIMTPIRDLEAKAPYAAYTLLDVSNGEALIQSNVGFRSVRVGDVLPEIGRINAIERLGDHWVLLSEKGAALESTPTPPTAAGTIAPRPKTSPR